MNLHACWAYPGTPRSSPQVISLWTVPPMRIDFPTERAHPVELRPRVQLCPRGGRVIDCQFTGSPGTTTPPGNEMPAPARTSCRAVAGTSRRLSRSPHVRSRWSPRAREGNRTLCLPVVGALCLLSYACGTRPVGVSAHPQLTDRFPCLGGGSFLAVPVTRPESHRSSASAQAVRTRLSGMSRPYQAVFGGFLRVTTARGLNRHPCGW